MEDYIKIQRKETMVPVRSFKHHRQTKLLVFCFILINASLALDVLLNFRGTNVESGNYVLVEPELNEVISRSSGSGRIPIIILFNEKSYDRDFASFMASHVSTHFELKYKFSIIPGISGLINKDAFMELKTTKIPIKICANSILSTTLRIADFKSLTSHSRPAQALNWWRSAIGVNSSLGNSLNGSGIKIGVIDTGIGFDQNGIYMTHADLTGKVVTSVNFASGMDPSDVYDEYGHGTHVAGIIAASGISSNGEYVGIAPEVKLYNVKVLNASGDGLEDDIIRGIEWCVEQHLDIINLSLGGGPPDPFDLESMAMKNATEHGVLVVVSAGNDGPGYLTVSSPGGAYGIITAGAIDSNIAISSFSSRGPSLGRVFKPDVVAPGEAIISTLGANSFIEKYYGFFDYTVPGQLGTSNYYVSLDGTSMAAPMVVGAAALIMQKFRSYHLPPSIIAASIMESAGDLGYDTCTQGMGLINVSSAIKFLETIKVQNNLTSMVKVFPKQGPYTPFDLINFPGDGQSVIFKVLYKTSQSVYFNFSAIPVQVNISVQPSPLLLNNASGEEYLNVSIRTRFDAYPGNYSITMYLKNASNSTLDTVVLNFTLSTPQLKVYFDSYHSLEDQYPIAYPNARFAMDYYSLFKNLSRSKVQAVTFMDYWTPGYNSIAIKNLLSYPWLKNFDAIIIPPLKMRLFDREIEALMRYLEAGGNIIILGSRYQEFSIESANELLGALGVAMHFHPSNYENLRDNGWEEKFFDIQLQNLNQSHFLNLGFDSLIWKSGCKLDNLDSRVSIVASDDSGQEVVAFLPSIGANGSIFVSGSESIFSLDTSESDQYNNTKLVSNLMNYFKRAGGIRINDNLSKMLIFNDTSISVFFQVFNETMGSFYNFSNITATTCTISNVSGKIMDVGLNDIQGNWFGNASVPVSLLAPSQEPYIIELNFTIDLTPFRYECAFQKYNNTVQVVNITIANESLYRGDGLFINFSSPVLNETMELSGIPDQVFSTRSPYLFSTDIVNRANNTIPLNINLPAGQYFINFKHGQSDGLYPYELVQRKSFTVMDHEPQFDMQNSVFQGTPFDAIDLGNNRVALQPAATNTDLSITVFGQDPETSTQALSAFAIFYPTCIIDNTAYLIRYGSSLFMTRLGYNASIGGFNGHITIPRSVTFIVAGNQVTREFVTAGDYSGAIIVVLRDDDGSYQIFSILLNLGGNQSQLAMILIWIVVALAIVLSVSALLSRLRKRGNIKQSFVENAVNSYSLDREQNMFKYCPYCGERIRSSTSRCPYCDKDINFIGTT